MHLSIIIIKSSISILKLQHLLLRLLSQLLVLLLLLEVDCTVEQAGRLLLDLSLVSMTMTIPPRLVPQMSISNRSDTPGGCQQRIPLVVREGDHYHHYFIF